MSGVVGSERRERDEIDIEIVSNRIKSGTRRVFLSIYLQPCYFLNIPQ